MKRKAASSLLIRRQQKTSPDHGRTASSMHPWPPSGILQITAFVIVMTKPWRELPLKLPATFECIVERVRERTIARLNLSGQPSKTLLTVQSALCAQHPSLPQSSPRRLSSSQVTRAIRLFGAAGSYLEQAKSYGTAKGCRVPACTPAVNIKWA